MLRERGQHRLARTKARGKRLAVRCKEKNYKYRRVSGLYDPVAGFQPNHLQAERDNRQKDADDLISARPTGSHGAGNEYHRKNKAASKPSGNFTQQQRIQSDKSQKRDARWTAGFGARLTAPTGGDTLGSGKWQIMPGAAVRYALFEVSPGSYFEPFVRYEVSFAGDPSKKNISNLQFAPTLNLSLPDHWFFTFYPSEDIRVNYGDPVTGQTGRLFLPFDFMVGRKLTQDLVLSLEVSVPIIKDYPVYDFKTEVRLNMLF
jgi:hypothetical protein